MKTRFMLKLKPAAAAVIGSLMIYGCGYFSGDNEDPAPAPVPVIAVPVAGANSPFIGVMMKVTCADGNTGQDLVGTSALPGEGVIHVSPACAPPIRIEAIGAGMMRPIGAKTDGSEDVVYDPAVNLPVSNVLLAIPSTSAPVNPVTTLVANQVTLDNAVTNLGTAKSLVATALGLTSADLDQDYRNGGVAEAATKIVEVAALAAAGAATNGMPAAVTTSKPLGTVIAEGLANQAKAAVPMTNATQIAGALKAVDAKLDVSASTSLVNIDSDGVRVNNLIVLNVPASTDTEGKVNALVAAAATTAASASAPTATQAQLVADVAARRRQVAQDSVRTAAAKLVASVTTTTDVSTAAVDVAKAAAAKIVGTATTSMSQSGAVPADIAAQGKAIAETITAAIQSDAAATNQIFAAPPTVGVAGAAAALVGQVSSSATVKALTATSSTPVDTAAAGADALKVVAALKDVAPPSLSDAANVVAFQAAVGAVAGKVDPATVNTTNTTTQANLATAINTLQTQLAAVLAASMPDAASAEVLAQQAAQSQLGGDTTKLDFSTPPTIGSTAPTLPTTTTTSSTSSTSKATTTTTTAAPTTTTTAAATTTTAAATTTTAAATTTTAAATTTTAAATTTTAAATTTTTAAATTTTAAPTTTTAAATTTTTAAPTTTTTTTTTTVAATACKVAIGSAAGYVTGAPSCTSSVLNTDGGGATVTAAAVPAGVTAWDFNTLATCDPFGAPPAAGATTLTPCKP